MRSRNIFAGLTMTALALAAISGHEARAAYVVTFVESGSDVVATGSGSIDTTDLSDFTSTFLSPIVIPSASAEFTGGATSVDDWSGITGPASFTTSADGGIFADSGSGDGVGIVAAYPIDPAQFLLLPSGYTSGAALSDTATWLNQSFADLSLQPGNYVWTWGSGQDADSFTVQIGDVPEPASLGLFAAALGVLGFCRRPRKAWNNAAPA